MMAPRMPPARWHKEGSHLGLTEKVTKLRLEKKTRNYGWRYQSVLFSGRGRFYRERHKMRKI